MKADENAFKNLTGWELVKELPLLLVPFNTLVLSDQLLSVIKEKINVPLDRFCWYSFFDNYKQSKDKTTYNRERYDIYPFEMIRRTHHTEILYEEKNGFDGAFCSWNKELKVGFLEYNEYYGYFILCK